MQRKGTGEVATDDQSVSLRKAFTTISQTCGVPEMQLCKTKCDERSVVVDPRDFYNMLFKMA